MFLRHSPAKAATAPVERDRSLASQGLVLVGAHGGAGTSTLATLFGRVEHSPVWDMGAIDDLLEPDHPPVQARGRPVAVVTRNTVAAARHATRAITAIDTTRAEGDDRIAALVVVSDGAGPEPRDASARFALLEGRICALLRMPFVGELRLVDDPADAELPAKARAVLGELWDVAFGHSHD